MILPIKSYEPVKICLIFKIEENNFKESQNLNENHTIRLSVSENPTEKASSSYLQKCGIVYSFFFFFFFVRRKIMDVCFFDFFPGIIALTQWY